MRPRHCVARAPRLQKALFEALASNDFLVTLAVMRPSASRPRRRRALALLAALFLPSHAIAAGPPVFFQQSANVDAVTAKRVRDMVSARRSLRDELPLPAPASVSTETAAMDERAKSIRLA